MQNSFIIIISGSNVTITLYYIYTLTGLATFNLQNNRFPQTPIIYLRHHGWNRTLSLVTFPASTLNVIEVAGLNSREDEQWKGFKREGSVIHYAVESGVVQLLNITQDRQKCHQINLKSAPPLWMRTRCFSLKVGALSGTLHAHMCAHTYIHTLFGGCYTANKLVTGDDCVLMKMWKCVLWKCMLRKNLNKIII